MARKKKAKTEDKQPSLYGDVDDMYNMLSVQKAALDDAVKAAEKRVESAKEHLDDVSGQQHNTVLMMKIVERRREELLPTKPAKNNAKDKH